MLPRRHAMTLLELLIVLGIIAALVALPPALSAPTTCGNSASPSTTTTTRKAHCPPAFRRTAVTSRIPA